MVLPYIINTVRNMEVELKRVKKYCILQKVCYNYYKISKYSNE